MTINQARNLNTGDRIISKKTGIIGEVQSLNEHISWTGSNTIIYIRCKVGNDIMKFSHKEVDLYNGWNNYIIFVVSSSQILLTNSKK